MKDASAQSLALEPEVVVEHEKLGAPTELMSVGQHLVVIDGMGDPAIHIIDGQSGEIRRSFGRSGEGPGEFRGAWSITPSMEDPEAVWIYDLRLARLTRVNVPEVLEEEKLNFDDDILNLQFDFTLTGPTWLSDTSMVSLGMFEDGRLAYLNPYNRTVAFRGAEPPGDNSIPVHVRQHAYQGTLEIARRSERIVVVNRHASRIEIYSLSGALLGYASTPEEFEPQYTVRWSGQDPVFASGEDLRFGYIDVALSDEYIYALYSGRTRSASGQYAQFGRELHVFDLEGNFRRMWMLDADVIDIDLEANSNTLFAAQILRLLAISNG
jgi:hypothetical protein